MAEKYQKGEGGFMESEMSLNTSEGSTRSNQDYNGRESMAVGVSLG